jgi:hypothetical protein
MSQEAQAVPAPQAPVLSTLQQYQVQLNMFKQQKEQVKVQFHQLEGAVFALEQLISQHEANLKQEVEKLAKDTANHLKPVENQGDNNGEAIEQGKKQASQK